MTGLVLNTSINIVVCFIDIFIEPTIQESMIKSMYVTINPICQCSVADPDPEYPGLFSNPDPDP